MPELFILEQWQAEKGMKSHCSIFYSHNKFMTGCAKVERNSGGVENTARAIWRKTQPR